MAETVYYAEAEALAVPPPLVCAEAKSTSEEAHPLAFHEEAALIGTVRPFRTAPIFCFPLFGKSLLT